MERFHRYYSLHRILSLRRLPVPRAAIERELECSRATVNRVIDDLRGYGAPIEYLREQNGYPIEVFWSDEDKGFIAIAPDLPGASAWGKTETEAIKELHTVIDLWIKAAKKAGNPVPKPSDRAGVNYSGKFLMRVPKRLHAELARAAKVQGVSLNQYVLYLLTKGHGERAQVRSVEHGEISRARRVA